MVSMVDRINEMKQRDERKLEAVAKAIFWEMNSVMHDHSGAWAKTNNKNVYRDCARAALTAAGHFV